MSTNFTNIHPMRNRTASSFGLLVASFLILFMGFSHTAQSQTLAVTTNNPVVCSGETALLDINVSGGQSPYTYSWSPPTGLSCTDCASPLVVTTSTSTYTVTVTDILGEQATATAVVTVDPPITISVVANPIPCEGLNGGNVFVNATGTPPFSFQWSNGFSGDSQGNLPPGVYCVTVTNATGCTASACATIVQLPLVAVTAAVEKASCGSTPDGSITLNVAGGTPPYLYQWSNGSTTQNLTGLIAGAYTLTLTESNGCTSLWTYDVGAELEAFAEPESVLLCDDQPVQLQGSSSSSGPNILYEWTGPNGFLVNTADALATTPGGYIFKVTDTSQSDCYTTDFSELIEFGSVIIDSMWVDLVACNTYQLSAILPPNYFGPIEFEWIFPDGTTSDMLSITTTQTGVYQLYTRIPGNPCESHISRFIDAEAQACATIAGRVVQDETTNCLAESTEAGLAGWVMIATGTTQNFFALTQVDGSYTFNLPLGLYTISTTPPTPSWEVCQPNPIISLANIGELQTADLAAQALETCPELNLALSSPFLRRCFDSYYYLSITNIGTAVAESPTVTMVLDEWLSYQNASIPATVNGQVLSWNLPDIGVGSTINIWIEVYVSCSAVLGQVHCTEVSAEPNVLCRPTEASWSGASLQVQGICDGDEVRFVVNNTGSGDLVQPVSYIVVEDAVMMMQAPGVLNSLPSGGEEIYSFPANGSTYTFRIEQAAFHPYDEFSPTVVVEGCGTNQEGSFSTGWTDLFPLQPTTPAMLIFCIANQGAYDPNDKQALPKGYGENHYLEAGDLINYRLRFQNTGTDTAFTVIIRDELSPWLDLTSLQAGNASHAYRLDLEGRSLLFTFDNILLPDSSTNLEGSQGFVDFRVRSSRETPLETRLENTAAIYFDFNEPVITNTVFHTIGEDFIEIINWVSTPLALGLHWRVYPNPATSSAVLELQSAPAGIYVVVISDLDGRERWRRSFTDSQTVLDAHLGAGLYLIRLMNDKGQSLGSGKLMIK